MSSNPAKLARYRAALDAGRPRRGAGWIAETQKDRQAAERWKPHNTMPDSVDRITKGQLIEILDQLGDLVDALGEAEPEYKLDVYRSLKLRLTYHPQTRTVRASVDRAAHRWRKVRVRGGT